MDPAPTHCSRCGGALNLIRIEPAWRQFERRIFECRECGHSESYTASLRVSAPHALASSEGPARDILNEREILDLGERAG